MEWFPLLTIFVISLRALWRRRSIWMLMLLVKVCPLLLITNVCTMIPQAVTIGNRRYPVNDNLRRLNL
jgi:hypothetical protein